MSTPKIGTGYVLSIDTTTVVSTNTRGTDANYKVVACALTTGLDSSQGDVSTTNKCDGGFDSSQAGNISWSLSFDGQAVTLGAGEASSKENYQKLMSLHVGKTIFFAKLESPDDAEYIREGKVRISSMSESQPNSDVFTVTATFQGTGELFIVPGV